MGIVDRRKVTRVEWRNTCMVWQYHVMVLPVNYVSAFCMELCINGMFHVKYTYMIDREHSHMIFPDHTSFSRVEWVNSLMVLFFFKLFIYLSFCKYFFFSFTDTTEDMLMDLKEKKKHNKERPKKVMRGIHFIYNMNLLENLLFYL